MELGERADKEDPWGEKLWSEYIVYFLIKKATLRKLKSYYADDSEVDSDNLKPPTMLSSSIIVALANPILIDDGYS